MRENEFDILSNEDERLLQSFFSDCKMVVPDDGFSDKVMRQLPKSSYWRLEYGWKVACIIVGIAFLLNQQVWASLQDSLFFVKIECLMFLSRFACSLSELLSLPHNWFMLLAGMVTVLFVWGYNKVQDVRY